MSVSNKLRQRAKGMAKSARAPKSSPSFDTQFLFPALAEYLGCKWAAAFFFSDIDLSFYFILVTRYRAVYERNGFDLMTANSDHPSRQYLFPRRGRDSQLCVYRARLILYFACGCQNHHGDRFSLFLTLLSDRLGLANITSHVIFMSFNCSVIRHH